jgi:hypothetical protein
VSAGLLLDRPRDGIELNTITEVRKWHDDAPDAPLWTPPDEIVVVEKNLLVYGGASAFWNRLLVAAPAVTVFDNTNARIGVGSSTTATTATMTDLQATPTRKVLDATYPQHTDATTAGAQTAVFRASFAAGEANNAWNEWAIFNGTATTGAAAGGRMLNRVVAALGTKSSGTWQLTLTLSLA